MKYMMMGNYRAPTFIRITLWCSLTFLVLFWLTNFLMYFRSMHLEPQSVAQYYLGSEQQFSMPRTYGAMLEVTHAHLASMSVVLLLVTHLALFFPWPLRLLVLLVIGCFGGALCGEAAGWLVRFVDPAFAWLKIGGFLLLQFSLGVLLMGLAWTLKSRPETSQPVPASAATPRHTG
jgi:hypothetical protein